MIDVAAAQTISKSLQTTKNNHPSGHTARHARERANIEKKDSDTTD